MKNKKNLLNIFIIVGAIPLFALFLFIANENDLRRASTDSGFDSSWDYGGSSSFDSGGSSYGGSSSWNSGSSGGGSSGSRSGSYRSGSSYDGTSYPLTQFLRMFFLVSAVVVGYLIVGSFATKRSKKIEEENYKEPDMTYKKYLVDEPGIDLSILENYGYDSDRLLEDIYKSYVDIQYAWSDLEIDKVKKLLSDELYNMYKSELSVLRAKKQQNVMKDFEYIGGKVLDLNEEKDTLTVKVRLLVKCKDYLVNSKDKTVLRGRPNYTNTYTYHMTYVIHKEEDITKCPNCNADLGEGNSVECEYCGTPIIKKSKRLVLTRKEMIRQS